MTLPTTDSFVEYVSGGPAFPVPYRFLQNSDIEALLVKQDGTSETLNGAQYSLTGAGNQGGGTLTSAYAAGFLATPGASLTISRIVSPVQLTDLRNQGKYFADTHETVFDRLTMLVQQGFAIFQRALVMPFGRDYYDAKGRNISNVKDPVGSQDATPKDWVRRFIADLVGQIQGPINNASNIFYQGPDGLPYVVQDLSSNDGLKLVGYRNGSPLAYLDHRVDASYFGLSTSNTAAQNAAALHAAMAVAKHIFIPPGSYQCHPVFPQSNGIMLFGAGPASELVQVLPGSWLLPNGDTTDQIGLFHIDSLSSAATIDDVTITNMKLTGSVAADGFLEHAHLVSGSGARRLRVLNNHLIGFRGDAVFFGSGSESGITERHNFDCHVIGNTIDGINNENRQAMSVVDGRVIHFSRNKVSNCTRSSMPGAVDVEPMMPYEATRDVFVYENEFDNVGGNSGVVCYNGNHLGMGGGFFTVSSNNIRVWKNTFRNCQNTGGLFGASVANLAPGPSTPPLDFEFSGNKCYNSRRVGTIVGAHGVKHKNNEYIDIDSGMFVGLAVGGAVYSFDTDGNTYTRVGRSNAAADGYAIQLSTVSYAFIGPGEKFIDCGKANGTFGVPIYFVDGASDHISIMGITTRNVTGKTTYSIRVLGSHTLAPETNVFEGNDLGVPANDFKWRSIALIGYTFATAITDLPEGESASVIQSGTYGPGVLKTSKYRDPVSLSFAQTTFQLFYPASTTADQFSFLMRKPDPSVGGWGAWKKFTGA